MSCSRLNNRIAETLLRRFALRSPQFLRVSIISELITFCRHLSAWRCSMRGRGAGVSANLRQICGFFSAPCTTLNHLLCKLKLRKMFPKTDDNAEARPRISVISELIHVLEAISVHGIASCVGKVPEFRSFWDGYAAFSLSPCVPSNHLLCKLNLCKLFPYKDR